MKRFLSTLLAACTSLVLMIPASFARDLSAAQRAELTTYIEDFSKSFLARDIGAIAKNTPEAIYYSVAEQFDLTIEEAIDLMLYSLGQLFLAVEFEAYEMSPSEVTSHVTPEGRPYYLVPTVVVFEMEGTRTRSTGQTLALQEGETWHLIAIDQPSAIEQLVAAYSDFELVDLPPTTFETLED